MIEEKMATWKRIILLGGGHSHALFLRMWAMSPVAGVELILISEDYLSPYSGMIPGLLHGEYTHAETHIDLAQLCDKAQASFIQASATAIHAKQKKIEFIDRPSLSYDILSINCGSEPKSDKIEGATWGHPIKPIKKFLKSWQNFLVAIDTSPLDSVSIIGGGAGAIELALACRKQLKSKGKDTAIHLFQNEAHLLGQGKRAHNCAMKILEKNKITVHLKEEVITLKENTLITDKTEFSSQYSFIVTQARPPGFIKNSELPKDEYGFILVEKTLQSTQFTNVFACGDNASIQSEPHPKSGVYAVRQGKILYQNILRFLRGQDLISKSLQKNTLALIGVKENSMALRAGWAFSSPHIWPIKKWIDQKFMAKFTDLSSAMNTPAKQKISNAETIILAKKSQMRCLGCGAKLANSILQNCLGQIKSEGLIADRDDIPVGLHNADDASVIIPPPNHQLVQSIDYFPVMMDDLYTCARIAANHCFSDIYAMGAKPHSALLQVNLGYASAKVMQDQLYQILRGVLAQMKEADAVLLGGHSAEGQTGIGLSCNAFIKTPSMTKSGAQVGEKIILTKALGTGAIFAAKMRGLAKGEWLDKSINSMLKSNYDAMLILKKYQVKSCTDVTGFGLAGHLYEMLKASAVSAKIKLDTIPLLQGFPELYQAEVYSSLHESNQESYSQYINDIRENSAQYQALFDPQTSGGLIFTINKNDADSCLQELREVGYPRSQIIASISEFKKNEPIQII